MKHWIVVVWTCLLLALLTPFSGAAAREELPEQVKELLQAVRPSWKTKLSARCGSAAVAVVSDGTTQALCLAEEKDGAWTLAAFNPSALRQDADVSGLLLDTEETLFWSYASQSGTTETLHAVRDDGCWRVADITTTETYDNGNTDEYCLSYRDGRLEFVMRTCDENDNVLSQNAYNPVPAAWAEALTPLEAYDDASFPRPNRNFTHSWLSQEATELAAAELLPDHKFLGGCASKNALELFLQAPDGRKIVAVYRYDEKNGWKTTTSKPLPEGTVYGWENFSSSLAIGDLLVNVGPVDESSCGVTFLYNMADNVSGQSMFSLGKNWVSEAGDLGFGRRFGDHPWSDISEIDWDSLPHTLEEALAIMDSSQWAVVNNPNPEDRLHLRVKPARDAKSLGKYYNGTPVRVLKKQGDWALVDVFGVQGWMMKKYLAFGSEGRRVEAAFPSRTAVETKKDHPLFAAPESGKPIACFESGQTLLVLGIVGEEWYHVWLPEDDRSGYAPQKDWQEGNG